MHRDLLDAVLVEIEHHLTLQRIGGVVEVNDRLLGAAQRLVRALEEFVTTLDQHLNPHVFGCEVLFDDLAHEVEVGLTGRGETDFDLREAHLHERVEHPALALGIHRIDESLVAVTQVDRAPQRGLRDDGVGPGAVVEHERDERRVLLKGHTPRCLVLELRVSIHGLAFRVVTAVGTNKKPRR